MWLAIKIKSARMLCFSQFFWTTLSLSLSLFLSLLSFTRPSWEQLISCCMNITQKSRRCWNKFDLYRRRCFAFRLEFPSRMCLHARSSSVIKNSLKFGWDRKSAQLFLFIIHHFSYVLWLISSRGSDVLSRVVGRDDWGKLITREIRRRAILTARFVLR